jgi:hypothetical protein
MGYITTLGNQNQRKEIVASSLILSLVLLLALSSVRAIAIVHAGLHALRLLSDVLHVLLDLSHHAIRACLSTHSSCCLLSCIHSTNGTVWTTAIYSFLAVDWNFQTFVFYSRGCLSDLDRP